MLVEEMRKLDECDMEEFGKLESSEKTIAILGDRWWPQTAKQEGDGVSKQFRCKTYDNGKPIVWPKSLQTFFGGYLLKYSG